MQDEPDYLTKNYIRIFDSSPQRVAAVADQLGILKTRPIYMFEAGPRANSNSLWLYLRINFPNEYGLRTCSRGTREVDPGVCL